MNEIIKYLSNLKIESHKKYIEAYIDLLDAFDLSEIHITDGQNVSLQEKLTEVRNKLWLPKAINVNNQKYFEVLND